MRTLCHIPRYAHYMDHAPSTPVEVNVKKQKEEWQYYILENVKTGETKKIKIGPTPIKAVEIMDKMKDAHKEAGIPFNVKNKDWVIKKAWVGA